MDKLVKVFEVIVDVDSQEAALPICAPAEKYDWLNRIILAPTPEAVIELLVAAGLYSERVPYRMSGNRYVFLIEPIPPITGPIFQEHPDGAVTVWRQ